MTALPNVPVPAVCLSCGQAFPSGIAIGPGITLTIGAVSSGPCPFCGGNGIVPSGVYRFTEFVVGLVNASALQRPQLNLLHEILEQAQRTAQANTDNSRTLARIEERISAEVPQAKALWPEIENFIKANANTLAALAFLVTIIGTLAGIAGAIFAYPAWKAAPSAAKLQKVDAVTAPPAPAAPLPPDDDPPLSPYAVFKTVAERAPPPRVVPARATPKVGRNKPCPCGSGRKKKRCHPE